MDHPIHVHPSIVSYWTLPDIRKISYVPHNGLKSVAT